MQQQQQLVAYMRGAAAGSAGLELQDRVWQGRPGAWQQLQLVSYMRGSSSKGHQL